MCFLLDSGSNNSRLMVVVQTVAGYRSLVKGSFLIKKAVIFWNSSQPPETFTAETWEKSQFLSYIFLETKTMQSSVVQNMFSFIFKT